MSYQLYNPFETYDFTPETCFLTGEKLASESEQITVFPKWILDRYELGEKKFTLMDQITSYKYADLKIPCSENVAANALLQLEDEIKTAFEAGFYEVKKLPGKRLFQWMAKIVYGVLYHDLLAERKRAARRNLEFKLSPLLIKRFSLLHLMLQSLVAPISFSERKPWSICIFKSKISKDVFNYKDEPTHLNFSLSMNDFGIVACLQDNAAVAEFQKDIVETFSNKTLHPVQLEEIFSRFIYTNYLMKYFPEYRIAETSEKVCINALPYNTEDLFKPWDDDLFAQVLAVYWKPWGLTKKEIYDFPNSPLSFLIDESTNEMIDPDTIQLPF
jgi:hypothetical protein